MKLLNCIFSYNRFYYLKNTVESLLEFFRFGDTIVFDDGSDDLAVVNYLSELENRGIQVIRQHRWSEEYYLYMHGGYYENHDQGIAFASDHGYDYIRFIDDDVQFMWHDPEFLNRVERIFRTFPDALQIIDFFSNAIGRDRAIRRLQPILHANCYYNYPFGMCTMGIVSVNLFKEHRFRYGNGREMTNSNWWRRRGYKAYALHAPTMVQVPWPEVIQDGKRVAKGCKPVNKYYLKPLDSLQIERLVSRPLEEIPFAEDYCLPWGWTCPKPYCYSDHKSHREILRKNRRIAWRAWRNNIKALLPASVKAPLRKAKRLLVK